ncbi:MAG: YIP1 family protein [Candidatus Eisenbacteria sp.]|nr:YIP1 family protein [Candidatus Eisenbacteria bacterium]
MGFQDAVKKGIEIVKLNREAYREVASEPAAFTQALIITGLAGVAMWLCPVAFTAWGVITGPLKALLALFIGTAILHFVAILLGGKGDFMALIRVLGVGRVLGWAAIIPVLGWIVNLWSLVMAVVAVEEIYGLDRTKAIMSVVLPFAVLFVLWIVMMLLVGFASMGALLFAA